MTDKTDFEKKQIVIIFTLDGDRLSILNDNLIVKDKSNHIKLQTTFYRIFCIFIIGNTSITTTLIRKTKQFGFSIALFSSGFHLYEVIGGRRDGNTILHKKQYELTDLSIGKHIIADKITCERNNLLAIRNKTVEQLKAINKLHDYIMRLNSIDSLNEIMGIEGLSAREYFSAYFNNVEWKGRKPRIKQDYVNSILDIGYTILFEFVDAILNIYGFDTYYGVFHRQFYMRKSLTCDIVEPFRVIIDKQVRKAINLKQFVDKDFIVENCQYRLARQKSKKYVKILLKAILSEKVSIFIYIQEFYRCFMKGKQLEFYPKYGDL